MRRLAIVIVLTLLAACGGGSSSPAAPTPPPPPPAPLGAAFKIVGSISFPGCPLSLAGSIGLTTQACAEFSWTGQNTGPGCATNVHGTVTVNDSYGNQLSSVEWSYNKPVGPDEQFVFSGGPVTASPQGGNAYATFTWTNISCQ